jgi:hypothetical protein
MSKSVIRKSEGNGEKRGGSGENERRKVTKKSGLNINGLLNVMKLKSSKI